MADETVKKSCIAKKIGLGVALLVIAGGVFVYMNMGSIAKTIAEKVGSDTLGVKVSISSIDISLKNKSVLVSGLSVANPKSFKKPHAMKVGSIHIAMDSFSKELLTFNDVSVKGSELFLEVTPKGTNLSAIKKNIDQNKKAPTEPKEESSKAAPKVILKNFLFAGAQLHPSQTLISGHDLKDVNVPDIKLTGIGVKQNGVLAREAIAQIWEAISKGALKASSNAGLLEGMSADSLKDLSSTMGISNIGGSASGKVEKAKEGIKSLFGQ
ncbi:MAG: hypothetical protein NZ828_00045 [Alphaproteobacteria bacterium]|nr:hypothetical protein [Alphaproteobacteria bacterium]